MRIRAPSDISTNSSLELSYSDLEGINSQLNMAENSESPKRTPHTFPTELPQVKDAPEAPSIPQGVINDEPIPSKLTIRKDNLFYCENVVLKVEDTLFCVPKTGLVKSGTFFDGLFNQDASEIAISPSQGSSDEDPIVLDGVSKDHFQDLLRLIFPFCGVDSPNTDEQWLGILHLATQWDIFHIREAALKHLEHLFQSPGSVTPHDPIRALALCIQYGINQHIVHQFELIITSMTPLEHGKMIDAGIDDDVVWHIAYMREKWLCGKIWGMNRHPSLVNHPLGLFPNRISAQQIVEDLLGRSNLVKLQSSVSMSEPKNDAMLEEEARLEVDVWRLKVQEAQIVDMLIREQAEAEAREIREREEVARRAIEDEQRRTAMEEREREERYEAALTVVAAEDGKTGEEQTSGLTAALKVIKEEQERRQRSAESVFVRDATSETAERHAKEENASSPLPVAESGGAKKKKWKKK
ncbi:hypothetical protein BJ165DRAFT_1000319 [Panaeolus papilionaceus]|nr:hypothetical protein BJ165DRAFT_1000319 [Panaeolus papilionaceus]